MKQKITYLLITVLILSGLYFGLNSYFGLFTKFNSWTAGQDIKNGKIQIVEIGEMPLNFKQKQRLANSYGFNFYLFGCSVKSATLNGTEYYNKKMVDHLESRFGSGWWIKFQSKIDSIDNINNTDLTNKSAVDCSFENIFSDPKIPKLAKDFFNNAAKYSDVPLSYFDTLQNKDKQKRNFYFRVITNSYNIADGSYSEGLGNLGKEFVESYPKEFATFFDNKACFTDIELKIWAEIVLLEFKIIDENTESGKGESLINIYSKKILKDDENYTENQKETIRKFTDYLKKGWNEYLKNR